MLLQMLPKAFMNTSLNYRNSFTASMIIASKNNKIDNLFIPCMYFTHCVLGAFGSFFFRYKYWAI
jgi:hypothetical protein